MTKDDITDLIEEKYTALISWLEEQSDESWTKGPETKWTTGQHALHLLQSTKPLNMALSLPKALLRYRFGKSNRPVRSYNKVIQRYNDRLEEAVGVTYKPSKIMKPPKLSDKSYILLRLQTEQKKLQYKTKKLKGKHLDQLVLPHPLMGKMPVREIIMWSAYHVEHHLNTLKEKYPK